MPKQTMDIVTCTYSLQVFIITGQFWFVASFMQQVVELLAIVHQY